VFLGPHLGKLLWCFMESHLLLGMLRILAFAFEQPTVMNSEGASVTQDDEKGYWGKITEVEDGRKDSIEGDLSHWGSKKIEIKGAVIVGVGLEPEPVGRFKMMEIEDEFVGEEEDEEDEYDEMSEDVVIQNANNLDSILVTTESDNQDSSDSFGLPGAFE
jgi:hypothetical protein